MSPSTDPPSKPGKPEVKDYDRTWCELKWKEPETDGGAPISHYVIERKDKYSAKWIKHCETKSSKPEAKVNDLTEGETYQFRVKAVNKAGQSKPSDSSDNFTAKAKFCKFPSSMRPVDTFCHPDFKCV